MESLVTKDENIVALLALVNVTGMLRANCNIY